MDIDRLISENVFYELTIDVWNIPAGWFKNIEREFEDLASGSGDQLSFDYNPAFKGITIGSSDKETINKAKRYLKSISGLIKGNPVNWRNEHILFSDSL
jgi:hypothetical protein